MALCAFSDNYPIFDITPVANIFLDDYMLHAPGDFVKVYLYGLRLCYLRDEQTDSKQLASVLGLEENIVQNAMLYWERRGIVRKISDHPLRYEYMNLLVQTLSMQSAPDDLYAMGQFNQETEKMLGADGRILHADDYARMYRWMEDYSLSETALLRVIEYLCEQNKSKGRKVPTINAVEKFILKMVEKKIVSDDSVSQYLHGLSSEIVMLKKLLTHLGIRKDEPSAAEEALFFKWLDWGFDYEALELLSDEMTKIQKPNFNYLDTIVTGYHEMGVRTAQQIQQYQTGLIKPAREIVAALGGSVSFSTQLVEIYSAYLSKGFEHMLLVEAAGIAARSGHGSVVYWQSILDRYETAGIFTMNAFEREKQRSLQLRQIAQRVFDAAGSTSSVTAKEVKVIEGWVSKGIREDLMIYAAQRCANSPYKLSSIGKLLDQWTDAGVSSPEEAAHFADKKPPTAAGDKQLSKNVSAQNYTQRQYDEAEYNKRVLFDLSKFGEEDDENQTSDH